MTEKTRNFLICLAIVFALSTGAFCLLFFLRHDMSIVGWMNALFYDGAIILALGLLVLVSHFGAFDILVYGVRDLFVHMNPHPTGQKKYQDYPDYVQKQTEGRKRRGLVLFYPFLIFGVGLLIAFAVIRIAFYSQTGIGI